MARIVSPVWSSIRGSIAGTTYLTTPAGQIIARQRTRPTQQPTIGRTSARDALTQAVADWQSLSAASQQLWNTWAQANPPGSGRHQFIAAQQKINYIINQGYNGVTVIATDLANPVFNGHPSFTLSPSNFATPASTGIAYTIKNTFAVDTWYLVEISAPLSIARNYWKGPWDLSHSVAHKIIPGTATQFSLTVAVAGQKFYVRCSPVTDGKAMLPAKAGRVSGTPLIIHCTSVTNP